MNLLRFGKLGIKRLCQYLFGENEYLSIKYFRKIFNKNLFFS